MEGDFLGGIEPVALRERVRAAVEQAVTQALTNVIATDPQLAPAAYLQRALNALARYGYENGRPPVRRYPSPPASPLREAAIADLQAAVASEDGVVVYKAASLLLQMHEKLAESGYKDTPSNRAARVARDRAVTGLHGGLKSHYTQEISEWFRSCSTLPFHVHPYALVAWVESRPGHTLTLPALDRFYEAAVALKVCSANPIPQVKQLLQPPPRLYSPQIR